MHSHDSEIGMRPNLRLHHRQGGHSRRVTVLMMGVLLIELSACVRLPSNLQVVNNFAPSRFLGRWYEVARLDHYFENGLDCVTASYAGRDDGGVEVVNRGVDLQAGKISVADGKGYFMQDRDLGQLKVSFFGPFYGAYNVVYVDSDYQRLIVAGPTRGYLWILTRQPSPKPELRRNLVQRAALMGFDTARLVYPDQGSACGPYRLD